MKINHILKKLKHKEGLRSLAANAPEGFEEAFKKAGFDTGKASGHQFTLLFVKNRSEVEKLLVPIVKNIEYDSIFWIAYPKGGSSIATDINRDKLWDLLRPLDYRPVSLVALDNDWSAMRFRPVKEVKTK